MLASATALRRARFRLQRQGMLELDRWLMPLAKALESNAHLVAAVEALLEHEPSVLQQMMEGARDIPRELQPWLG